jgi:N-acetylglucosamine-6-phosphate deacetylase
MKAMKSVSVPARALVFSVGFFTILCCHPAAAQTPTTRPIEGLSKHEPAVFALSEARIVTAPGKVIEKGIVVIRDGAIAAVGADVKPPDDAQIVPLAERTIYPGLIDAYSEITVPAPASTSSDWSPKIVPQADVTGPYKLDVALNKTLRSQGITARLIAPQAGLIKGTSALVATGDDPGPRSLRSGPRSTPPRRWAR